MESKYYSIFGVTFEIKSDNKKVLDSINSLIKYFSKKRKINNPTNTFIFATSRNVLGQMAYEKFGKKPLFRYNNLICCKKKKNYFFTDKKSLVFFNPDGGIVKGNISEDTLKNSRVFSHIFFYIILAEMLRYSGLYYLHSSCVEKDGASILFPGNAGIGKSTISIAFVRMGFSYLSDDSILLKRIKKGVIAHPIPGDFHIDPAISERYSELSEIKKAFKYGKGPKRSFDPVIFYPDSFVLRSKPNIIIFPEIVREARSVLMPLSSLQCLGRLIPSSLLVMMDKRIAKEHLETLKILSTQCRAFQLLSGKDMILEPDKVVKNILKEVEKDDV